MDRRRHAAPKAAEDGEAGGARNGRGVDDPARITCSQRCRASQLFLPTLREDPADAEAASHKLLVRGGFIRQVGAGLWTFLPLGWRVHRKIEQIIREEMNAIGGQEMLMPVLTPVGALGEDRARQDPRALSRPGPLGPTVHPAALTHEETVTFHAREIQSYKELPQLWYHFSIKDRDEPRPRGGLLRVREFIMKDAYSFDRDDGQCARELRAHNVALTERIFDRCELEAYRRPGRERDHGRHSSHWASWRRRLGREHARSRARTATTAPISRSRSRRPACREFPEPSGGAGGGGDAGRDDDRGARRAPRHRPGSDV